MLYPTYKFSVRTSYASMCQELHVDLKESPIEIYKTEPAELTDEERMELWRRLYHNDIFTKDNWKQSELDEAIRMAWEEHGNFYKCLNEVTKSVIDNVDSFVKSYNYSDCDGMQDYFDVDFYYFGCVRNNGQNIRIVPKTARIKNKSEETAQATVVSSEEYEITESIHTKTGAKIWLVKVVRTLSRDEYIKVNQLMKSYGGYYSKFTHSFVFDHDPTEELGKVAA